MAEAPSTLMALKNINQLSEFFQYFENNEIEFSNVIESITYNVQSQTIVIQMANLLRKSGDTISRGRSEPKDDDELRRLADSYRRQYPELLHHFKNWQPCREELIQTSTTCADQIDRNFTFVSGFRILTSVVDIFGALTKYQESGSSWCQFAFESASAFGLMSLFMEMTLSKQMHIKTKRAIKKDQDMFEHMKNFFKQSEELDAAVKRFFPYGIDEDLVRQIDKSATNSDEYSKLFMSIIASNVRKNINLFKDINFLDKAEKFATSDAGLLWFHKVTLQNNPVRNEILKSEIGEEINKIFSSTLEKPEIYLDASLLLSSRIKLKILLNAVTIFSAVSNLWNQTKSDDSGALRSLAVKSKAELNAMKSVVELLKPPGFELDGVLQGDSVCELS